MTNVTKIKDSAIDKVAILDTLDDLKSRLHFLNNALPLMLSSDSAPSDEAVCGVVLAIDDCCTAVTKVSNGISGGMT